MQFQSLLPPKADSYLYLLELPPYTILFAHVTPFDEIPFLPSLTHIILATSRSLFLLEQFNLKDAKIIRMKHSSFCQSKTYETLNHHLVFYHQQLLFDELTIYPISDGLGEGHIWILEMNNTSIGLLLNGGISGWKNCDFRALQGLDVLILGNHWRIEEINFSQTIKILKNEQKNGLLPVYDLSRWVDWIVREGDQNMKWFVVGGNLKNWIGIGNAGVEYQGEKHMNMVMKLTPEKPMKKLEKMMQDGIVSHFESIFELIDHNKNKSFEQLIKLNAPCVYVIIDPMMDNGLGEKFLNLLEKGGDKCLLLCEPNIQTSEVFKPFKDKSSALVKYCPLDFRFTWEELSYQLDKLFFKQVVLPKGRMIDHSNMIFYENFETLPIQLAIQNNKDKFDWNQETNEWSEFDELKMLFGELKIQDQSVSFKPLTQEIKYHGVLVQPNEAQKQLFQKQIINFLQDKFEDIQYKGQDDYMFFLSKNEVILAIYLDQDKTKIYHTQFMDDILRIMQQCFLFMT